MIDIFLRLHEAFPSSNSPYFSNSSFQGRDNYSCAITLSRKSIETVTVIFVHFKIKWEIILTVYEPAFENEHIGFNPVKNMVRGRNNIGSNGDNSIFFLHYVRELIFFF